MGNFNRDGERNGGGGFRSGGRDAQRDGGRQGGFQKKSWSGGTDRVNKEQMMHQATCSECGKRCEVPFRPVNGKPVYCNDCFSVKKGANTNAGGDRVPAKIHYENRDNRGSGNDDGVRRLLSEMNMKLDRLVKAIEIFTGTTVKSAPVETPKKEEKKNVDVIELKKVLDQAVKKETKTAPKKTVKKAALAKNKK